MKICNLRSGYLDLKVINKYSNAYYLEEKRLPDTVYVFYYFKDENHVKGFSQQQMELT
jgi:hypothetical protein